MKTKRPWGSYTVLTRAQGYKVKLVEVSPHKKLSLQKHNHRSEHWVVVKGKAKVTNGKGISYLKKNESSYIPKDVIHRLENPGRTLLRIIEVQCGRYLGEDDIERFEDDYGKRSI